MNGTSILIETEVNFQCRVTFDPAEWLISPESVATFMSEAFKTHDTGYIAHAWGVVIREAG
jgi:DNA-binding phage protein